MNDKTLFLGRISELPSGTMREVEVAGNKILLVRQGDELRAIGARCPHAGGPLADGVLANGRVICPWHKAAFCIRTGKCLEPPAVDNVQKFPIEIKNGEILLAGHGHLPQDENPALPDPRQFVILGAGAAGFSAAQELRRAGFAGAIVMVSHEDALPYDRTVLSKYALADQKTGEKTPLQTADFYVRRKIERCHAKVVALETKDKRVILSDGRKLAYDAALIATGGSILPAPFPGSDLGQVFNLRSQADALRIVDAATQSRRAAIIGASFIGMEVAAALRERGLEVTVVAREAAPFERQLGPTIGNVYREIHEEKGVRFRFNAQIERLEGKDDVSAVLLAGGERIAADFVVLGLGVRPATEFAGALTHTPDHALTVDNHMRVQSDLYAAGDVAAFPIYGEGPSLRVEHWRVAEQQGRIAARNMLGGSEVFDAVPYFWTIQYMVRLDYVGHAKGDDTLVVRGDPAKRHFIAYYLQDGVVAAAAGMNHDKDMAAIIVMMNAHRKWTVDQLHPENASPYQILVKQQQNRS
jgi:apoptosis-inducing factor 3